MCTGKCSRFIAVSLYPLVLLSIACNIILLFPGWKVKYVKEGHITEEVKYMGGLIGGGIMMLIPALYIHLTGQEGCCGNRFGFVMLMTEECEERIGHRNMFLSIIFAAVGAAGAMYSFCVALLGLTNGPFCFTSTGWDTPFKNRNNTYLNQRDTWSVCKEPHNVVQFNMGLFITLMIASALQGVLCAIQMINGLIGCLCGMCYNKEEV